MRSFELNDEASLNILDNAFAARMTAVMEADLARSVPYTLAMWQRRPWKQRLAEAITWPFRSQL
jgi:cardiolipin synthase